jgi:poly-beta-1,6-N-acetyl-D-glucosamine synthase
MNTEQYRLIILIIFLLGALIQLIYYLIIYMRFVAYSSKSKRDDKVPVSIVICARNEAINLEKYLPRILEQNYPEYEVVVVNDCSEDETEEVLKRYSMMYPRLRWTFIKEDEKFSHGKKLALTVGIKSAKNEWLLLTDADCYPESNNWLATMAKHFVENKAIVIGYGGYRRKKGLLNMLIRFDTSIIALNYFSYALIGKPYMGVGRNLAYRKTLFFANKGFATHVKLNSGDDDLFINEVANKKNIIIEPYFEAHTRSEPKNTFDHWVDQKKRHFGTFMHYKKIHKFLLGTEIFSRFIFYLFFIWSLIVQEYWIATVSVFFARFISQLVVFKYTFKRLNERNLFLISPIFDLILPMFNMGIYLSNLFSPKRKWR